MIEEIEYLKRHYPSAVVRESCDKDYILVRTITCNGTKIDGMSVPLTKTEKFHVDTIRIRIVHEMLSQI